MKILFLSFYFEPDLSAGSFRNKSLVSELQRILPEGSHIDIMTTSPSRYSNYKLRAANIEIFDDLSIRRFKVLNLNNGLMSQSLAFLIYAFRVFVQTRYRNYDIVYASSSRLMTAALGAFIARKKDLPLYLDIRDIFVDTLQDVFSKKFSWAFLPVFSKIEQYSINTAKNVNLVSPGFKNYFISKYSKANLTFFTNGIDVEFQSFSLNNKQSKSALSKPKVVYTGNLGSGQALEIIIPKLAKKLSDRLDFVIIGDGVKKQELERSLERENIKNVEILPPISRSKIKEVFETADILFLHLNKKEAFLKVLPSKVFEYAATGKPIWAGVGGFAAEFLNSNVTNTAVFDPCDEIDAIKVLNSLKMESVSRQSFVKKYSREKIMKEMACDILNCYREKLQ